MAVSLQRDAKKAAQDVATVKDRLPDLTQNLGQVKLPDVCRRKGNKDTPVADVRGIVEIIMLLPGHRAARVRRQAAELLVRYLGGDMRIVDEVIALRGLQEELAGRAPEDPRRLFGEAVEAASTTDGHAMIPDTGMALDRKRLLEDVERTVRAVVHDELQQHHVWSFSKRSRNHRELLEIGQVVQGSARKTFGAHNCII